MDSGLEFRDNSRAGLPGAVQHPLATGTRQLQWFGFDF